ncbi:hypothetical protein DFH08DRAFT_1023793, partial [Mycena albidolilacea]
RSTKRSRWKKIDDVLKTWGFRNLGDFLATLFHPRTRGQNDPRSKTHRQVSAFLKGRLTRSMADTIPLIFHHHASRPKQSDTDEQSASPSRPLSDIRYARPCLSAWATRLVGDHAYFCVGHHPGANAGQIAYVGIPPHKPKKIKSKSGRSTKSKSSATASTLVSGPLSASRATFAGVRDSGVDAESPKGE